MSRTKASHQVDTRARGAWRRVLHATARLQPAAARAMPAAKSTQAAALRQAGRARAWAAPQVERTGQVLQHTVAPKVSAMLSAAAHRLEPAKPQRRPWRKLAGASAAAAAASAAVAAARSRKKAGATGPADQAETGEHTTAEDLRNGQATPGSDAG
jgi:hypothetical protein